MDMGRKKSCKSAPLIRLGLSAFFIFLTLDKVNGGAHHTYGSGGGLYGGGYYGGGGGGGGGAYYGGGGGGGGFYGGGGGGAGHYAGGGGGAGHYAGGGGGAGHYAGGGGGGGGGFYSGGGGGGHYAGGGFLASPPMVITPQVWPEVITGIAIGGVQGFGGQGGGAGFYDHGGNTGFANNGGYYDDLFAQRNSYDVGKGFGNGYDYGKGSVVGAGYRELDGRNKGHTASGFSNSYRKDESGDRSSYYDDGLGHHGKINYGAQDTRSRDQGGHLGRGGFHKTNLNRYGTGGVGRFGDSLVYSRGGNTGGHIKEGIYGFRAGRLLEPPPVALPVDSNHTGLYVIPVPDKLFFDQTPPPL